MNAINRRWFIRMLLRSLFRRAGRVAVALISVTIAVAIVISALGLSIGIREKLGHELSAYGANVIVSAPEGLRQQAVVQTLEAAPGVEGYSLQLYGSVLMGQTDQMGQTGQMGQMGQTVGDDIEIIGMDMGDVLGWRLSGNGRLPDSGAPEVLVGRDVQAAFGLRLGDAVMLSSGHRGNGESKVYRAVGFVERGGPEDKAVMLWLADAQRLLGVEGMVSAVFLRAEPGRAHEAVKSISRLHPGASVRTIKQVAGAEESLLSKMELLMALVSVVVLLGAGISLSSTMSATVLERLKEVGLMKAIGATRRDVLAFFVTEGAVIGLGGGMAGFVIGSVVAMTVSMGAFGSVLYVSPGLLLLAAVLGMTVSVGASLGPLMAAMRLRPSVILRGE